MYIYIIITIYVYIYLAPYPRFYFLGTLRESQGWNDIFEHLSRKASELTDGQEFDSALLNLYRDGQDKVAAHRWTLLMIAWASKASHTYSPDYMKRFSIGRDEDAMKGYIVSFTFGSTRDFVIRTAEDKKVVEKFPLAGGSALIMKPGMQQQYLHELPKRANAAERINVTLRQHQSFAPGKTVRAWGCCREGAFCCIFE